VTGVENNERFARAGKANVNGKRPLGFTLMRSKTYILQNFCIIDSMKLYKQGFPFLYNTFYQGGNILPGGGRATLATPLLMSL
jgi:hypothetical protein